MEPINYRRAILRRWPLIVVCAIVGAVVAVLIPVHATNSQTMWQVQAIAGVPPKGSNSSSGNPPTASLTEIKFYAEQQQLYQDLAKVLGKGYGGPTALHKDITLRSKKSLPSGSIEVLAKQTTKDKAVKLVNAFVKELATYADQQLASQHNTAIQSANSQIMSLAAQIETTSAQIAALTKTSKKSSSKPGSKSKTTPSTTSTTVAKTHRTTTTTSSTTTTTARTTTTTAPTTTTTAPTTTTTAKGLPASTTTPTTSTTTVPTTVPTTGASQTTGGIVFLAAQTAATSQSTATTSKSTATTSKGSGSGASKLSVLQSQLKALQTEYQAAQAHLQQLTVSGTTKSGFVLLSAARAASAKEIPAKSQLLAHRSVRAGVGFLAGIVLGLAIAFLRDAFDKRLRSVARTQQTFGLPVIAEIPKTGNRQAKRGRRGRPTKRGRPGLQPESFQPSIPLVDAPASYVAEAYRRLRVSVLFAPVAQYSSEGPAGSGDTHLNGSRSFAATSDDRGSPSNGSEAGQQASDLVRSDPRRDVVMVVCPAREPTAHEVVVNLAAAYAEAGERVLVVTTTDLRSIRPGFSGDGTGSPMANVVPVPGAIAQEPSDEPSDSPTQPLPVVGAGAPVYSGGLPTAPSAGVRVEPATRAAHTRSAVTVEEVVAKCRPQRVSGVSMLQLGELLRGPGEVPARGSAVISAARQIADVVLVEAPGMLAVPDAEGLARAVDAVIVVAQSFHTTVGQATRSGELLRRSGAPTLGVVLTDVEVRQKDLRKSSRGTDVRSESF